MTDNTTSDLDQHTKDLWDMRIKAPAQALSALLLDHKIRQDEIIGSMLNVGESVLEQSLNGMLATGTCDWYVEPAKKTCNNLNKLSKGFAIAASEIANFFEDIYVGKDFRDVLLNTEQAPTSYPNSIVSSSGYFLKTISQYLPENFWQQSEELKQIEIGLSVVGAFAANEQTMAETTTLQILFEAQRMSRVMPKIAKELRNNNRQNLATIADCFASKGTAMSEDIIKKVNTSINNGAELNVITKGPTGP